ncbi:MAG: ankyrin repeat domain-containing protein [Myxococcota bacterium]
MAPGKPTPTNRVMGTGEPRLPEPFTLEQRFLHAVRTADRASVERALELGVDPNAKDDLGRNAFLLAVRDARSLELAKLLRARGAAVDVPDAEGRTAFSHAAARADLALVEYLAAQGAALDAPDAQGRTPLFHAVAANRVETARFLIERGADVDVRDRFQDTPLMIACAKGHGPIAELLVASGADRALRDQEGRTAADRAAPGTPGCAAPPTSGPDPAP